MAKADRFSYSILTGMLLAMCLAATLAHADDDDDEEERHDKHEHRQHNQSERDRHATSVSNPQLKEECGSCHIVYPPNMLPAASWRALMANLNKHFGSDASLDAATQRELSILLQKEAGSNAGEASAKPVLRITETRWFQHEHDEVSARTWRNPKVKSPANCGACHTQAEQGKFNEHDIRMPR